MDPSIITMTNKEAQRLTIINNLIAEKINGIDASKQLNLSIRQTKRLKARVIIEGTQGIIHKLRGKVSHNKEKLFRFRTNSDYGKTNGNPQN